MMIIIIHLTKMYQLQSIDQKEELEKDMKKIYIHLMIRVIYLINYSRKKIIINKNI